MEKEVSRGTMLGITLIALSVVIGLIFGVFITTKGTANCGVMAVEESLNLVESTLFMDFNQKIVTGNQLIGALNDLKGKPYTILIATQAVKDNTINTGVIESTSPGIQQYSESKPPTASAYTSKPVSAPMLVAKSTDVSNLPTCELTFIQYNALLGNHKNSEVAQVMFDDSCWRAIDGYKVSSDTVVNNRLTQNLSKPGMIEHVPFNAKFQSYLIRDASNTIMGIALEQLSIK